MKVAKIIFVFLFTNLGIFYCHAQSDEMVTRQGFITLNISASKMFFGGTINISGSSGQYQNINSVTLNIVGPKTNIQKTIILKDSKYETNWVGDKAVGNFTITAVSSDGKATIDKQAEVYVIAKIENMASDNLAGNKVALQNLVNVYDDVKPKLSAKDLESLDSKMEIARANIEGFNSFYKEINNANKIIAQKLKMGVQLPMNFSRNLSLLNSGLQQDAERINKINTNGKHTEYGNTICDLLALLNETAAAFSTVTNFLVLPFSLVTLVTNITTDKVVPLATDFVDDKSAVKSNDYNKDGTKELTKCMAAAAVSGTEVISKMSGAGIVGDMVSFVTDILMKRYCIILTGLVKQELVENFRNKTGETWWKYSYNTESMLTLRCPKNDAGGNIVKMKGKIEGNATYFNFFQDVTKEDDFTTALKGRIAGRHFIQLTPIYIPFSTTTHDKLGFGAAARALVTPAYFNINVDAQYNRDAGTIKLFLIQPPVWFDFSPVIKGQVLFFDLVPFPLVTYQAFPFEKVYISMNAVIKRSKGYATITDKNNNIGFKIADGFHVGTSSDDIEIDVKLNGKISQQ